MKKRGFVFDLDGTLVDSLPGIAVAINGALESLGLPPHDPEVIRSMVGRGSRELCKSALATKELFPDAVPMEQVDALLAGFMKEYPLAWRGGTIAYPGVKNVLKRLADTGHRLAVLSNKPHEVTLPLVECLFPDIPFEVVMGHSDKFPRKPNPAALLHIATEWGFDPLEVTMVGDSAHDGRTAVNAGTSLVLVGWGYSTPDALNAFQVPVCKNAQELGECLLME